MSKPQSFYERWNLQKKRNEEQRQLKKSLGLGENATIVFEKKGKLQSFFSFVADKITLLFKIAFFLAIAGVVTAIATLLINEHTRLTLIEMLSQLF